MRHYSLLAVGLAVLVLVAGCAGTSPSASQSPTPDDRTIRVSGSGSAEGEPNRAVLRVGVVATADTASAARQQLAENVTRMREALREINVTDDQITTVRYDIDRDRRRPRKEGGEPRVQYRAAHSFEITLTEIDRVGTVIDTAVQNGATEVEDIRFTLSTERRRQLEESARQAAMTDARQKAESLASSANLTVTGVKVIRTSGGAPRPSGDAAAATPVATQAAGAPSKVESGPVTVVTTVYVVYNAAPAENESS